MRNRPGWYVKYFYAHVQDDLADEDVMLLDTGAEVSRNQIVTYIDDFRGF